jgi:hypothetical protein
MARGGFRIPGATGFRGCSGVCRRSWLNNLPFVAWICCLRRRVLVGLFPRRLLLAFSGSHDVAGVRVVSAHKLILQRQHLGLVQLAIE